NTLGALIRKKEFINPLKLRSFVTHLAETTDLLGTSKAKIFKALFASFLFYIADIATLYFSFLVFGFRPPLALLVFGFIISTAIALFTLMPETPGIMETSLTVVFVALQFPPHAALLASLLFRIFTFWVPLALGVLVYIKLKKTTGASS
ncbi:MAG: flippase-like domain-containing protein, partial [Candidatus Spechtbacteria bacterium]|nr:flippase-like domain-containing protein [Candidatus Spechtbacteria bacterium]